MTQTLHPLYGSTIDDYRIARAINLPPGVYEGMEPTIRGSGGETGWTAYLGVDSTHGRSLWRTAGNVAYGRYIIEETEAVSVAIAGPDANPRIDLIVGVHKWIQGPLDAVSLTPTGEISDAQRPSYVVIKGTAAESPVAPTVPDPYGSTGSRAVILAKVYVPTSGEPIISRYVPTDLRLPYMRSIVEEVVNARADYPNLGGRLDAMPTVDTYRDPNVGVNAWASAYNNSDTFANMTGFAILNAGIGLAMAWGTSDRVQSMFVTSQTRAYDVKLNCKFAKVFHGHASFINESYGYVATTPLWPLPSSYKTSLPNADVYDDDITMQVIGLKLADSNNDGLTTLMAYLNGLAAGGAPSAQIEYGRVQCFALGILDRTFLAGLTSKGRHLKITS